MVLDDPDRHPTPTSVSPPNHGQEVMDEEQPSESEEEMTYIGWEQVRSGDTISKQVPELEAPGPSRGFSDQSRYDDYDNHMPSLGNDIREDTAASGSMAAAEQTECKRVSQLPSTWSSLINPGIWISGTVSSSRSRV